MTHKSFQKRLLVCGDRNWADRLLIHQWLEALRPEVVIEGEAPGADTLAREEAWALHIPVVGFQAEWDVYGKAAGPIRNQAMLDYGHPTAVLAFHPDLRASRGTADMVRRAQRAMLPVTVVRSPDTTPRMWPL